MDGSEPDAEPEQRREVGSNRVEDGGEGASGIKDAAGGGRGLGFAPSVAVFKSPEEVELDLSVSRARIAGVALLVVAVFYFLMFLGVLGSSLLVVCGVLALQAGRARSLSATNMLIGALVVTGLFFLVHFALWLLQADSVAKTVCTSDDDDPDSFASCRTFIIVEALLYLALTVAFCSFSLFTSVGLLHSVRRIEPASAS